MNKTYQHILWGLSLSYVHPQLLEYWMEEAKWWLREFVPPGNT